MFSAASLIARRTGFDIKRRMTKPFQQVSLSSSSVRFGYSRNSRMPQNTFPWLVFRDAPTKAGRAACYTSLAEDEDLDLDEATKKYLSPRWWHFWVSMPARYTNVAESLAENGNDDGAIKLYEKALPLMLKNGWDKDDRTAEVYTSMGTAFTNKGDYEEAIKYSEKALDILMAKGVYKSSQWDRIVVSTYHNMTQAYTKLADDFAAKGEHDRAREYRDHGDQFRNALDSHEYQE